MTAINNAYINALLADATYALDGKIRDGSEGSVLSDLLVLNQRLTPTLAKYIGDNFTVVTHYESSAAGFEDDGFDGTVWKDNANPSKYYFSVRGTTPFDPKDTAEDIVLATTGLARDQTLEMINWWIRNSAPEGGDTYRLRYEIPSQQGPGPDSMPRFVRDDFSSSDANVDPEMLGTGILKDVKNISMSGHSLGGHLATVFARLFGGANGPQIDHTATYNSAGFYDRSEELLQQIEGLLDANTSSGVFPTGGQNSQQTNFFAQNGPNFTTNDWISSQKGDREGLFNEENTVRIDSNHSIYKLTDSLALGRVFETLDASFDFAQMRVAT